MYIVLPIAFIVCIVFLTVFFKLFQPSPGYLHRSWLTNVNLNITFLQVSYKNCVVFLLSYSINHIARCVRGAGTVHWG